MGAGTLANAEGRIKSLFGPYVGVNFVTSGPSDFTLNVANASPGHTGDLGHQTGWWIFQGTPVVHPNNITNFQARDPGWSMAYNNIIGTIGAHELLHRMGIGDLKPYDPNNPTDLMSLDVNPNFEKVLINNSLKLTQAEAKRLQTDCLEKHPE